MDYRKTNAPTTTVTRDMMELCEDTGNVYESVAIIGKRANQISVEIKNDLSKKLAEFASYNDNLAPLREALSAFVDSTQQAVNGTVKLKLYKGNCINAGVKSPNSLYMEEIATFGDSHDLYSHKDSAGFINLLGLPLKVKAMVEQKNKK